MSQSLWMRLGAVNIPESSRTSTRARGIGARPPVSCGVMVDSAAFSLAKEVARAVATRGGRAWLVGGTVRDRLRQTTPRDFDLEVFRLASEPLLEVLRRVGKVDDVGRSFGILKVTRDGATVDVGLPRRDSKAARGHRGFDVFADPNLSERDACARRDLTINAILEDPLTGEINDPFDGRGDLARRLLRRVTDAFDEDPLRALRVVQFAARFEFAIDPETAARCRRLDLGELSRERVFEELKKWLAAPRPSVGMRALVETGALSVLPELASLQGVPQDNEWHPEGDVYRHTSMCLDFAATLAHEAPRPDAFLFAVLLHDLGKAASTRLDRGRWRSLAHDETGAVLARSAMERLTNETALIDEVVTLVRLHLRPGQLARDAASDGAIRRLARQCDLRMLALVAEADAQGRALPRERGRLREWLMERAAALDVAEHAPAPLLLGRHLIALGVAPGPRMGSLLNEAFERQLAGTIATQDAAIEWAKERVRRP